MRLFLAIVYILIICSFLPPYSSAQECDSIITSKDSSDARYFLHNADSLALGKIHSVKVSMKDAQYFTPLHQNNPFFASLGNPGLAYESLIFTPSWKNGFDFGQHSFDEYLYTPLNTEYYLLSDPYTDIFYAMGGKKEQILKIKFDRNISRNVGIGANFRYVFAPGRYKRQKADDKSFTGKAQFFTNNRRYGVLAAYLHNKVYVQENGGIQSDSIFELGLETDRQLYLVNLNSAQNQIKENSFFVNQYVNLSKPSGPEGQKSKFGRITYTYYQIRQTQKYIDDDPKSGFYDHIYLDSTRTFDSVYYFNVENGITWSNLGYNDSAFLKPFYIYMGAKYRYTELGGYIPREYLRQWQYSAGFHYRFLENFFINAQYAVISGDYNNGDFSGKAGIGYKFMKDSIPRGTLYLMARISKQEPAYFYHRYSANNFRWENSFSKEDNFQAGLSYTRKRLSAGVVYMSLGNFVYLDQNALPAQHNKTFNVYRAYLSREQWFWKFCLDGELIYQHSTNKDILRLPDFAANASLFFRSWIFGRAATIQPGVDFFYNTAYYADAYMPALRSFYLQDEKEIGNYVYMDVYLMLRVKRAVIFLKYQHFNTLFGDHRYYMVPHYPMQDAAFKFGVSWKFYN
ncbi:MAG: putative porin [Bacteroidetes bacterium]|nr:putative porin [Bacteroidota bacterium]